LASGTAAPAAESKAPAKPAQVKAAAASKAPRTAAPTGSGAALTSQPAEAQPPRGPESLEAAESEGAEQAIPDWLTRFYESSAARAQLIPTHELLRMANALGIDVDYSTLRFWQKRHLVPKPVRGPVSSGRGTRGYYDPSLMDRLSFIRAIQKNHAMGLEAIRDELDRIDKKMAQSANASPAALYEERLNELQARRDAESRRTLISMIGKAVGLGSEEIATIVIRKKDGQTIRLLADKVLSEQS